MRRTRGSLGSLLVGLVIGLGLSIGYRMLLSPCRRTGGSSIHRHSDEALRMNYKQENGGDSKGVKSSLTTPEGGGDGAIPKRGEDQGDMMNINSNVEEPLSPVLLPFVDLDSIQLGNYYSLHDRLPAGITGATAAETKPAWKRTQRNLLLVGVMTAQKYLDNRAIGVFETWAQDIPGRVIFFTGSNGFSSYLPKKDDSTSWRQNFTVVALDGVDDTYPPQRKSFMMLKYMYEHYGDDYEWFMRADDDVYVKGEKLAEFLRSINSRQLYFIGQAGKGNRAEKGTLKLAHNENFCMGGPGIILSRATIAKIAPFINDCLQDMYSTHEDVEVGRCVKRFAGISCTWAYEMQSIFYHNASGDEAFSGYLKSREVHRGITLHPVKNFRHMYRLHSYILGLKIQDLLQESIAIQRDLLSLSNLRKDLNNLNGSSQNISQGSVFGCNFTPFELAELNVVGLPPALNKFRPRNATDLIKWSFLQRGLFSFENSNPKQKVDGALKEGLEDVVREVMEFINGYSRVRGRVIDFKEILYGYHRVDPLHGDDFVLDLLMTYKKYRGRKMTIPVRRHAYIQRSFSGLQLRIVDSPPRFPQLGTNRITMILPLSGRLPALHRFLESFSTSCKQWTSSESLEFQIMLMIVYFSNSNTLEDQKEVFNLINSFRKSLECEVRIVQLNGEFSRSVALETGIAQCRESDLLFLIDVDISFTSSALDRVRLNTIKGQQVYFPIVFSEFDPEFRPSDSVNERNGYWREYGFGIAAFYKSDFKQVTGFDTSIKGWGKEDVSLYEKFVSTNLTIFRAPDPDLKHIFHEIVCDEGLSPAQYEMCLGTKRNTLGSTYDLTKYLFQHRPKGRIKKLLEQSDTDHAGAAAA